MDRLRPKTFPVVIMDSLQTVQIGVVAATTDLHHLETRHGDMLNSDQRKVIHHWHDQLDRIGREIGDILGS